MIQYQTWLTCKHNLNYTSFCWQVRFSFNTLNTWKSHCFSSHYDVISLNVSWTDLTQTKQSCSIILLSNSFCLRFSKSPENDSDCLKILHLRFSRVIQTTSLCERSQLIVMKTKVFRVRKRLEKTISKSLTSLWLIPSRSRQIGRDIFELRRISSQRHLFFFVRIGQRRIFLSTIETRSWCVFNVSNHIGRDADEALSFQIWVSGFFLQRESFYNFYLRGTLTLIVLFQLGLKLIEGA